MGVTFQSLRPILRTFHYGVREFAIDDNNGYMLQFGTPTRR
jgi:hypothetical protein